MLNKIEAVQKKAVKWILGEEYDHYTVGEYNTKLSSLDILPMKLRFAFADLVFLHRILLKDICVRLPEYIDLIPIEHVIPADRADDGDLPRLRHTHKDPLFLVCKTDPRVNVFRQSYFYRTHLLWNNLPLELRLIQCCEEFRDKLKAHLMGSFGPDSDDGSEIEPD